MLASVFMILEMVVLLVAEPKPSTTLLVLFALNRLFSGAGEAMASGADEALAYDSLKDAGLEDRWSEVLEWQTRFSSIAFFLAMLIGAAVYDPQVLNKVASLLGLAASFRPEDTLKYPIWLTLVNAVLALLAALSMKPVQSELVQQASQDKESPWQKVRQVGSSLLKRDRVLAVILAVLLFDQAARAALTMSSKTFAAFGIPEAWFGVIGASFALLGAFVSGSARKLVERKSQAFLFFFLTGLTLVGLVGQATASNAIGLVFVACLSVVMSLVGFFASFYLNQLSSSDERATLLSFKGLVCNIGFGVVSLYYSGVTSVWDSQSDANYLRSLYSLPVYFVVCFALFFVWKSLRNEVSQQDVAEDQSEQS